MIEFKNAFYEKAFDLFDQIEELGKKKKIAINKLKDAIYECYEESKKDDEEDSMKYRNYRMRRNMRHDDEDMFDMSDNRSGRYSY